jgi:hypothetical protein
LVSSVHVNRYVVFYQRQTFLEKLLRPQSVA